MNQKVKLVISIVIFAAVIGGSLMLYRSLAGTYSVDNGEKQMTQKESGKDLAEQKLAKAPDFTVVDAEGKEVKLSDFKGTPVVLNFWASWCPPCRAEMPGFDKLAKEMDGDVVFLMVNMTDGTRETKAKAKDFVEKQGFSFPVYFDEKQLAAYAYGITVLPTTCFIDREGNFVQGIRGGIAEAQLRENIARIRQ